jgi:two-component system chemotaxis response regulator CheY
MTGARCVRSTLRRGREATLGKRVLIVDDEPDIRLVVRVFATSVGHEIVGEAADGREAIEMARLHQPDAIVLDVMMPGMTGLEALPEIRAACPTATVIIFSVLSHDTDAVALADGWVQKGEPLETLSDAIG